MRSRGFGTRHVCGDGRERIQTHGHKYTVIPIDPCTHTREGRLCACAVLGGMLRGGLLLRVTFAQHPGCDEGPLKLGWPGGVGVGVG